jgi:hypothetical protein
MNPFLVRVELHNALYATDYNVLHVAMQKSGFSRNILANDGKRYDLPTAEYYITGNFAIQAIHSLAKAAANSTGKVSNVLVVQFSSWFGDLPVSK